MSETLLEETRIGEFLSMGAVMEADEVGLFIASADVSSSCGFQFDEWEKFVEGVEAAHKKYLAARQNR